MTDFLSLDGIDVFISFIYFISLYILSQGETPLLDKSVYEKIDDVLKGF